MSMIFVLLSIYQFAEHLGGQIRMNNSNLLLSTVAIIK